MNVTRIGRGEWRESLPSTGVEVFHDPDALSVLADHSDAELHLLCGFKGEHPVAFLPAFVAERRVGRVVTSPPPGFGVPRLGPVLDPNSPKRRKRELLNGRFAESVVEALGLAGRTTLFRMTCPVGFEDPRPYDWQDFTVDTAFTYVVDLDVPDLEAAMAPFSSSLRNEMRRLDDSAVTITVEGADAAVRVYDHVAERYEEQAESAPMSRAFVRDLVAALGEDRCRVYVARDPDGNYLSGIVALFSDEVAYYWQGGVHASYDNVSVNNLLHRAVIEDVLTDPDLESVTGYDLVGANTERLCQYKGKFGGRLRPYYAVESAGPEMALAKSAYRVLSNSLGKH